MLNFIVEHREIALKSIFVIPALYSNLQELQLYNQKIIFSIYLVFTIGVYNSLKLIQFSSVNITRQVPHGVTETIETYEIFPFCCVSLLFYYGMFLL